MKSEVVSMCRGKTCCPQVEFFEDGRVVVSENGQSVSFSKDSFEIFVEEIDKRRKQRG